MLSIEERCAVARAAVETVEGRAPIVIGAQSTDQRAVLEMAQLAEDLGAYAIQVSPPYYYQPSDEDVLRWFRTVNTSLKKTGIMVYNTYWHGYNFPLEVLDKVIELDRVVSVKWATPYGGLDYMQGVARYAPKVAVVDNALMWPVTYSLGGTGFVTHLGTVWPECVLEIHGMLKSGKYQEATEAMQARKWPWADFRGKMSKRTGAEAPPVKCALELRGRPGGPVRPPSRDLNPQEREELRTLLTRLGVPAA
jgi:4-hydroxy-tetrahydrodipicolinate synthase